MKNKIQSSVANVTPAETRQAAPQDHAAGNGRVVTLRTERRRQARVGKEPHVEIASGRITQRTKCPNKSTNHVINGNVSVVVVPVSALS